MSHKDKSNTRGGTGTGPLYGPCPACPACPGAATPPEGRHIVYEGVDPAGFVEEIKKEFGFDPSADPEWGKLDYFFLCPAEHLDAIYGDDSRWPMGS